MHSIILANVFFYRHCRCLTDCFDCFILFIIIYFFLQKVYVILIITTDDIIIVVIAIHIIIALILPSLRLAESGHGIKKRTSCAALSYPPISDAQIRGDFVRS